jgi:hypothetical protein
VTVFLLRACSQARCALGTPRNVHSSGAAVVGASREASWPTLVPPVRRPFVGWDTRGQALSVLLLRAAVASVSM